MEEIFRAYFTPIGLLEILATKQAIISIDSQIAGIPKDLALLFGSASRNWMNISRGNEETFS